VGAGDIALLLWEGTGVALTIYWPTIDFKIASLLADSILASVALISSLRLRVLIIFKLPLYGVVVKRYCRFELPASAVIYLDDGN
jgi:hypothetical protein